MLGTQKAHARLFYDFDLETHIPENHLVRGIDRFLDLRELHADLRAFTVTPGDHQSTRNSVSACSSSAM